MSSRLVPIGPLIAELRAAAGLSQARLAERLNAITGKTLTRWDISRWETGRRIPVGDLPALAIVLEVSVDVLAEAVEATRAVRLSRPDPASADGLAAVLDAHRRLEDVVGAAAVLPAATAHQQQTEQALGNARGPVRERLTEVAASSAQFAGWLNSAAHQPQRAGRFFDVSLRQSLEGGDDDAAATALSMRGHLAWRQRDVGEMIAATKAAQNLARLPGTRAITTQQEARGRALEGDERSALTLIDEAESLYGDGNGPESLYFYSPAMLLMQRGIVLHYLGRHEAAEILTEGLASLPAEVVGAPWTEWYREVLREAQAGRRWSPAR